MKLDFKAYAAAVGKTQGVFPQFACGATRPLRCGLIWDVMYTGNSTATFTHIDAHVCIYTQVFVCMSAYVSVCRHACTHANIETAHSVYLNLCT